MFRDFMEGNPDESSHGDPVAVVTSENASRRHLNTSQLAHAIAAMAGWEREQAKKRQVAGLRHGDSPSVQPCTNGSEHGRTSEKLAAKTGVSARTVDKAIKVREAGVVELNKMVGLQGQTLGRADPVRCCGSSQACLESSVNAWSSASLFKFYLQRGSASANC